MGIEGGGRRRGGLAAVVAGLVVSVVVGAVLAFGSTPTPAPTSGGGDHAAGTPSAGTGTRPPSAAPRSATPTPPAEKAAGHVSHGVHAGDLRYFLLPPPQGADVYGDPAGDPDSAAEVAVGSPDEGRAEQALKSYGFRGAATRTYLTADGLSEVTVDLVRLGGPDQAAGYYGSSYYQATEVPLRGSYPARGYNLASGSAESTDTLLAVSYQGDVHITISLTGGSAPSRALLQQLLDAQYQRLKTGR